MSEEEVDTEPERTEREDEGLVQKIKNIFKRG